MDRKGHLPHQDAKIGPFQLVCCNALFGGRRPTPPTERMRPGVEDRHASGLAATIGMAPTAGRGELTRAPLPARWRPIRGRRGCQSRVSDAEPRRADRMARGHGRLLNVN